MTALNRARFTTIPRFALLHTAATSDPICSPSRSQSVQIMSMSAFRASALRLRSTDLRFLYNQLYFCDCRQEGNEARETAGRVM